MSSIQIMTAVMARAATILIQTSGFSTVINLNSEVFLVGFLITEMTLLCGYTESDEYCYFRSIRGDHGRRNFTIYRDGTIIIYIAEEH